MKYDECIKIAYNMIENLHYNELFDDLKQEIAIELWLNPDEKIDDLVLRCKKKVFGEEKKHQRGRAESIYNDEGECLDDDLYFVDDRTIEHNDFSYISDEIRKKVSSITKTRDLICEIYKLRNTVNSKKLYAVSHSDYFIWKILKLQQHYIHNFIKNNTQSYSKIILKGKIDYENKRNKRIALQSN